MPHGETMSGCEKIKWGSGLSVIGDTCHHKAKQKGDTWEPCVTPLEKNQVGDKNG